MADKERDSAILKKALFEEGYRHIDTAKLYGNEELIGEVLEEGIKDGHFKREELFVTTKLWHDEADDPVGALKRSLERLKLDYVD